MASKADYREDLESKLLGLEDGGYGDFEYTEEELDTYIALVVSALFPSLYKRNSEDGLTLTSYGSTGFAYSDIDAPEERIYLVEDAETFEVVMGWETRPGRIIGLDDTLSSVNAYYYGAYTLPVADAEDTTIPDEWTPLIVLGGLIEALESRHDTGIRPDDMPMGYQQSSLIDRLSGRYERMKQDVAMSLPVRRS